MSEQDLNPGSAGVSSLNGVTGVANITSTGGTIAVTTPGGGTINLETVGGGGGAPVNATYLTLTNNASLTNNRTIAATSNLSLTDGGATNPLTIGTGAFTGDVTTSANSFATTISNNAVTYGKIQQASASIILGNPTGSPANVSEITLGTNLSFSGSVLNATGISSITSSDGSLTVSGSDVIINVGHSNTWTGIQSFQDGLGFNSSNMSLRLSWDAAGFESIDWGGRLLTDSAIVTSIDWQNRTRNAPNGSVVDTWSNTALTMSKKLALQAGSTAAGSEPLQFTSGALLTSATAGTMEFLTDKYYATITTGAARKELALWDSAGTSGRVPYETTNGRLIDSAGLEFSTVGGQILTLGGTTSGIGKLVIQGNTSGAITIQPQTSSGTYNFNLPITAGSTGQPLISQGGGSTAMTFGTLGLTGGGTGTSSISSGSANGVICLNSSGNAFVATSSGNTSPQTYLAGGGSGSPTFQQVQAVSLNLSSFTLGTTNGGTGRSAAYTIGDILYASSSSLVGVIAAVATGSLLVSNGTSTNPIYSSSPSLAGKFAKYNNITTAGWGIPAIYAAGRSVAQSAAVASVSTYTVGAADGSFEISANVLVTASTLHNFTVTCAYTDEGNTARTLTLSFSQLAGTFLTSIANAGGTVPYEGIPLHIRCKASTSITIATTGTFTNVTYNVEGIIKQTA